MTSSRKISSRSKTFAGSCSGGNESKVRGPKGEDWRVPKVMPWLLDLVNKTEPSWARVLRVVEGKDFKRKDSKGVGSRVKANKRAGIKVTDSKGAGAMASGPLVRVVSSPKRIGIQGKRTAKMAGVSTVSSARKVTTTQPRISNVSIAWELAIFKLTVPKS
jgi:hypothetical protein